MDENHIEQTKVSTADSGGVVGVKITTVPLLAEMEASSCLGPCLIQSGWCKEEEKKKRSTSLVRTHVKLG